MTRNDQTMPLLHRWRTMKTIGLVVGTMSCTSVAPPPSVTVAVSPDVMAMPYTKDSVRFRGFPEAVTLSCTRMHWTTCDPLWTDDQALKGDANDYGPHAYIIPAPDLGTLVTDAAFTNARLVGVVYVKPGPRPTTYTQLNLTAAYTCIFLQASTAPVVYRAFLIPNTSGNCTGVTPVPPQTSYEVRAAPVPPAFDAHDDIQNAAQIPPVARFHEGKRGPEKEIPLLGMRCGNKWCIILPNASYPDSLRLPHKGDHAIKTWEVHGWHDVQHLSKRGALGGTFDRTPHEASIVPDVDLAAKNFAVGAQHAATIKFWGNPTGDYASKWGFSNGENELYLMKVTIGGKDYWHGLVINSRGDAMPVYVEKHHPGSNPPATARFRWDIEDEGIWVECDDGCCYVSAAS